MSEEIVNQDAVPPAGDYYVTVRQNGSPTAKTVALLGPYDDLRDALANVDRGRRLVWARDADPFNEYAYGTSRVRIDAPVKTVFGG